MVVLGLDISTTCTGYCLMEHITEGRYELIPIKYGAIKLTKHKKNLMKKIDVVLIKLKTVFEEYGYPDIVQIEDSLSGYKHGYTSMNVIITLAGFNLAVSYGVYRLTKKYPLYINPVTARKKAWGDTFHYIKDRRKKKEAIVHCVVKKYPYILDTLPVRPRAGGFADEAFDICDSFTIASCIPNLRNENETS